jgi:hypothetical protein
MPSDNRRCSIGRWWLEDQLIVEQADSPASGKPGRDRSEKRIFDQPPDLAVL